MARQLQGATHPSLVRNEGEKYRMNLERMAKELGVQKHVIFYNRFVELDELTEFIGAADLSPATRLLSPSPTIMKAIAPMTMHGAGFDGAAG